MEVKQPTQNRKNTQIKRLEIFVPVTSAFLTIKELSCCLMHSCLHLAILLMTEGDFTSLMQEEHKCQALWPQNKERISWGTAIYFTNMATLAQLTQP